MTQGHPYPPNLNQVQPRPMPKIALPYKFVPREYQLPFWRAMRGPSNPEGKIRACLVDHRRAGKDKNAFNYMIQQTFMRVGIYYYFFPSYAQGRKALWDNIDAQGFKMLDHIPMDLVAGLNQTEMKIALKNASIIQVVGSDNIDTVVGSNPVGCVFSEYPLQDPSGYNFVRPILRENGGWAVFTYTPRGKNHGYDLFAMAQGNPEWYVEKLTVQDTWGRGGTISEAQVEEERKAGMSESLIQQEFYVSFDAAVENAVFASQLLQARSENRITRVPYQKGIPVNTYWDIGRDGVAIWFEQTVRNEVRLIDYHIATGSELANEVKVLQERPYVYGTHFFPHDGDFRDYKTGTTPKEVASELGLNVEVLPKTWEHAHIDAARMMFNRCWFDEEKCRRGLDALQNWHFAWDEKLRLLSTKAVHDWSSHASKALCYLAVGHQDEDEWKKPDAYAQKPKKHRSWMTA